MTTPALSLATPFGRLYRRPGAPVPQDIAAAVGAGALVPSITNVIGVAEKPYLRDWAARLAAEAAIGVAARYAERVEARPGDAARWAAGAANRCMAEAGARGDAVHDLCERRITGDSTPVPDDLAGFMEAFDAFTATHDVSYSAAETTVYGECDGRGYAGTADFHATVDGVPVVGDWKTGKHVGDDAAMQLAALASAGRAAHGDKLRPAPRVDAAIAVKLHGDGTYALYPVKDIQVAFTEFGRLRAVWDGHARRQASSRPTMLAAVWRRPARRRIA